MYGDEQDKEKRDLPVIGIGEGGARPSSEPEPEEIEELENDDWLNLLSNTTRCVV
jgi:hypothetical protein